MIRSRRLWALALLALVTTFVVAAVVLWQRSGDRHGTSITPETSPLPVPTTAAGASSPFSWFDLTAALFWVVLGGLFALGITFIILRRHKSTR